MIESTNLESINSLPKSKNLERKPQILTLRCFMKVDAVDYCMHQND